MPKYHVVETTTYIADDEELADKYFDEYASFAAENPDASPEDWIRDCIDGGGTGLFEFDSVDYDIHKAS